MNIHINIINQETHIANYEMLKKIKSRFSKLFNFPLNQLKKI